jgi:DnaA family protein
MQIPLELRLPVKAGLNDFIADNKQEILSAFKTVIDAKSHIFLYIAGSADTGKTHLLSALCLLAESSGQNIIYLPLKQANDFSPEICEGLEAADIICIDDIDQVAGNREWELAVFNLYNRIRDAEKKLVVSSNQSPASIPITLADLKSRLAWGITLTMQNLSDTYKKHILQQRAQHLGLELPGETVNYLLRHHHRTLTSLLETLHELDRASLAEQRKLTVPFVRDFLAREKPQY